MRAGRSRCKAQGRGTSATEKSATLEPPFAPSSLRALCRTPTRTTTTKVRREGRSAPATPRRATGRVVTEGEVALRAALSRADATDAVLPRRSGGRERAVA